MPLEYYPPVINMLDDLALENNLKVKVWSTQNTKGRQVYRNNALNKISRTLFPSSRHHKIYRLTTYMLFNLNVFLGLIKYNPNTIFYYETYSAGPVYWYLKYFGRYKKLFIHCHEYFDTKWYKTGMAIVKLYYAYEKKFLYNKATWISHTNSFRIRLFLEEHPKISPSKLHIMPNYPPNSWFNKNTFFKQTINGNSTLNIVYIGSLSLEHTFISEFCNWVISRNGEVNFDIFAFNCTKSTNTYLRNLDSAFVNFYDKGIEYNKIPTVLAHYDIGVILYKATTLNAKYCASNKLFEYLVCGLEVWVSKEQNGTLPYINKEAQPRVKALDFLNIDPFIISDYYWSQSLPFSRKKFQFSSVSKKIIAAFQD
tara:strand:+ start:24327 stop:25430 length:1104 start_codon:yes stop_codon:yes gene_type:complete